MGDNRVTTAAHGVLGLKSSGGCSKGQVGGGIMAPRDVHILITGDGSCDPTQQEGRGRCGSVQGLEVERPSWLMQVTQCNHGGP